MTPCKNRCIFDNKFNICRGCGRDKSDLRAWKCMNNRDRAIRMKVAEKSLQQLALDELGG